MANKTTTLAAVKKKLQTASSQDFYFPTCIECTVHFYLNEMLENSSQPHFKQFISSTVWLASRSNDRRQRSPFPSLRPLTLALATQKIIKSKTPMTEYLETLNLFPCRDTPKEVTWLTGSHPFPAAPRGWRHKNRKGPYWPSRQKTLLDSTWNWGFISGQRQTLCGLSTLRPLS